MKKKHVIVISFDAVSKEDLDFLSKLPNFSKLIKEGALIKNVESIYPSLTYPAHATIVTGKYPKNHGIIKIDIILEEKGIQILFEDNGIGIPLEMKDKIFDRFLRLDNSLRRLNEGSGIGLSIVKSMVEVHGGSISVNSILNQGSVFEVKLPNTLLDNSIMNIYKFNEANTEIELSDIYN